MAETHHEKHGIRLYKISVPAAASARAQLMARASREDPGAKGLVSCACVACERAGRKISNRAGKRAAGCLNKVNSTNLYVDKRDMGAVDVAAAAVAAERSGDTITFCESSTAASAVGRGRSMGSHRDLASALRFDPTSGDGRVEHAALLDQEWDCCPACFQAWYVVGSSGLFDRARSAVDAGSVEPETAVRNTTSSCTATDSVVAWVEQILVPECESYPATTHGEGYYVTFYYTTVETYVHYRLCDRPGVVYAGGSHGGHAGPSTFARILDEYSTGDRRTRLDNLPIRSRTARKGGFQECGDCKKLRLAVQEARNPSERSAAVTLFRGHIAHVRAQRNDGTLAEVAASAPNSNILYLNQVGSSLFILRVMQLIFLLWQDAWGKDKTAFPCMRRSEGGATIPHKVVGAEVVGNNERYAKSAFAFSVLPDAHPSLSSDLTVEVLSRVIGHLHRLDMAAGRVPQRHLRWQVDGGPDNRSKHVLAFLAMLVAIGFFQTTDICIFQKGHTHNSQDRLFGIWSHLLEFLILWGPFCWFEWLSGVKNKGSHSAQPYVHCETIWRVRNWSAWSEHNGLVEQGLQHHGTARDWTHIHRFSFQKTTVDVPDYFPGVVQRTAPTADRPRSHVFCANREWVHEGEWCGVPNFAPDADNGSVVFCSPFDSVEGDDDGYHKAGPTERATITSARSTMFNNTLDPTSKRCMFAAESPKLAAVRLDWDQTFVKAVADEPDAGMVTLADLKVMAAERQEAWRAECRADSDIQEKYVQKHSNTLPFRPLTTPRHPKTPVAAPNARVNARVNSRVCAVPRYGSAVSAPDRDGANGLWWEQQPAVLQDWLDDGIAAHGGNCVICVKKGAASLEKLMCAWCPSVVHVKCMRDGSDAALIALLLPSNAEPEIPPAGKRRRKSPAVAGHVHRHSDHRWCCSDCQDDMAAGKAFVVNEDDV